MAAKPSEHNYDHRRKVCNSRKVDMRKICAAIYLHPVALIFVNIIVDQIWLKAKIFGLLMTTKKKNATTNQKRAASTGGDSMT